MEFLYEYGMFLAKAVTVLVVLLLVIGSIGALRSKEKVKSGNIEIKHINGKIDDVRDSLKNEILDKLELKAELKAKKAQEKAELKEKKKALKAASKEQDIDTESDAEVQKHIYVLDFDGDIKASAVDSLREEITAVLAVTKPADEVVVRLESPGGLVHAYGLAASQLKRITNKEIKLTVCVDKVAASGGYMMAAVANYIVAAPFAILGSIGVVAQIPNFHRLLKKNDIDYELLTAGEYKRTLTTLGENTEKGREKFIEDLEDTHVLFKAFLSENRPQIDIDKVATGEVWFGKRALDQQLIDELKTSDEYIISACDSAEVYEVKYVEKKNLAEKLGFAMQESLDGVLLRWWQRLVEKRYQV